MGSVEDLMTKIRSVVEQHVTTGTTTKPTDGPPRKILFLDGLRGLAAMMVVVQHSSMLKISTGQAAVDIFFVLSAFLLTMIFEKKAATLLDQHASPKRWGYALLDYFMRRFLRIYPLFTVVAIFVGLLPKDMQGNLYLVDKEYSLWRVLTFQFEYRFFVFWTLPLEITYYLIIPPFTIAMLKLGRFWWAAVLSLVGYIAYAGVTYFRWYHQGFGPHFPTFLTGSVTAIVYTRTDAWMKASNFVFTWKSRLVLRAFQVFNIVILFSLIFEGLAFRWWFDNPVHETPGVPFIHGHVGMLLWSEMLLPGPISSVLKWSLLRHAGKVSFSMYLTHVIVARAVWLMYQPTYERFFAIWVLVFLVATVSYHVIEAPCQVLATKLGQVIKARDAEIRGYTMRVPSRACLVEMETEPASPLVNLSPSTAMPA